MPIETTDTVRIEADAKALYEAPDIELVIMLGTDGTHRVTVFYKQDSETLAVRDMSAISDATLTGFEATFTTAAATVVSAFEKYVINTFESENSGSDFTQT